MGVSTDGILFYGYIWVDEDSVPMPLDAGSGKEWPELVAKARGLSDPFDEMWEKLGLDASQMEIAEAERLRQTQINAWFKALRQIESEFGCDVGRHLSGDCPLPYVFAKSTETRASRGYPVPIADLDKPDGADEALATFLKELGVEPPEGQKPSWWLTSYWG